MYQNALASFPLTVAGVTYEYNCALNDIADHILVKHVFGIDAKIDRIKAIKIKNLLPYLTNDTQTTATLNKFKSALNV